MFDWVLDKLLGAHQGVNLLKLTLQQSFHDEHLNVFRKTVFVKSMIIR